MNCQESFFMIQRHYDGELSMEEQALLNRHLLGCADCKAEFDDYALLFGDISALVVQIEHRDILSETLQRVEAAETRRKIDMWWRGAAVAASLAIIAGTAFFTWTETGRGVRHTVASMLHHEKPQAVQMLNQEVKPKVPAEETTVENNPDKAAQAIVAIRKAASFPLLELNDPRLQLDSTSLTGGDESSKYQLVELEYKVMDAKGQPSDSLFLIATPDNSMKAKAKSYLGTYEYTRNGGELTAGAFKWARVGQHAITAEINGVFYQLFSPFMSTDQLAEYAVKVKKLQQ